MIKVRGIGTITIKDVEEITLKYPNENICIVIENTKYQYPEILEEIATKFPKVFFSVTGGLDPKKQKFNNEHYQSRTYFTSIELSNIIKIYQSIERKILLSWSDTQKVMFVYQQLCNHMVYDKCWDKGRDCCRSIIGLLYGKAVCSGFAMIFKEAMDRLGYQNIYQNKQNEHSWNIVYLDGAYRAFELTWDTYNKPKDGCGFMYFNQDENFYKNKHHDLSGESEEKEYDIVPYTMYELIRNRRAISSPRLLKFPIENGKTSKISFLGREIQFTSINNDDLHVTGMQYKKFVRKDGSIFILIYTGNQDKLNKFFYFEKNGNQINGARIYSELRLDALSKEFDYTIANGLLSKERLKQKIDGFNGYVGYFGVNHQIYYDSDFERENLNITRK